MSQPILISFCKGDEYVSFFLTVDYDMDKLGDTCEHLKRMGMERIQIVRWSQAPMRGSGK